jgi:alpha-L-arabinofuranosidase
VKILSLLCLPLALAAPLFGDTAAPARPAATTPQEPVYPFPILSLKAARADGTAVQLSWQPDPRNTNLDHYEILRDFQPLAEVGPDATSYTDTAAPLSESSYLVLPVNTLGHKAARPGLYFRFGVRPDRVEAAGDGFLDRVLESPYVTGLDLFAFWNELEPEQGEYNFSYLETVMELAAKHHKQVKLTIYPSQLGSFAPWQEEQMTVLVEEPKPGQIKLDGTPLPPRKRLYPLDPAFREAWQDFLMVFAERYADDPRISSIDLEGPSAFSTHMRTPPTDAGLERWESLGFTKDAWREAWIEDGMLFMDLWPNTPVSLNCGLDPHLGAAFLASIYEPLYAEYGNRLMLRNEAVNGQDWYVDPAPGNPWYAYREYMREVSQRAGVGYEMWKFSWSPEGLDTGANGPMDRALQAALTDGGTWVHIWPQDYRSGYEPLYRTFAGKFGVAIVPQKTYVAGDEYAGVDLGGGAGDSATGPVLAKIDTRQPVRAVPPTLLGFNQNWLWGEATVIDPETHEISPGFLKVMKGLPIPLVRMSGSASQHYHWKRMLGDPAQRTPYQLLPGRKPLMQYLGPLEWADAMLRVNPDIAFSWSLNLLEESPEENAELVQLFTAGADNAWGRQRIEYGLKEPLNIAIWELGNEMDWIKEPWSVEQYVEHCRQVIAAIRAVNPDAKFAAQSATAPWSPRHQNTPGGWAQFHRTVLKELGDEIDYITIHPYYHGMTPAALAPYLDTIRDDIVKIIGSPRIQVYISEHARWPPAPKDPAKNRFANDHLTHGLSGCLATVEFLNLMVYRPEVTAAAYHNLLGGPWKVYAVDAETGEYYATGVKPTFQLLHDAYDGTAVTCQLIGEQTDIDSSELTLTATAVLDADGGLRLFFNNRNPDQPRLVKVELDHPYELTAVQTVTAPAMDAYNTARAQPVQLSQEDVEPSGQAFTQALVPAKTAILYRLRPLTPEQ